MVDDHFLVEFSKLRTDISASYDPPASLDRYELLGVIGTGGMATVYLARTAGEAGFQRLFAIKILHPHLAKEESFVTMLLDEARIAARLHHPNVVPIVDLGSANGLHYVVMEYVEGCSLSALFRRKREERPPRLVLPLLLDMLSGLEAAHSLTDDDGKPMNLVHRDVSPQNTLIGADGVGRITDFGIARAESRIHSTRPGQVKGKYAYMSPEQVRAQPVDRRADVFSCGVMLWSMLTARKLFQGESDAATMTNIVELEVPPPSSVGLKPPDAYDAVALKALDRDPEKRFATAQEMEEALREAGMKAGGLASRREISSWVTEAFRDELEARRKAIRAAVATRSSGSIPAVRAVSQIELPTFTPSGTSGRSETPVAGVVVRVPPLGVRAPASGVRAPLIEETVPNVPEQVEMIVEPSPTIPSMPTMAAPSRHKRLMAIAAAPAAIAIAIVVWLATRSSETPPSAKPTAPTAAATTPTTSPPSPPSSASTASAPASTTTAASTTPSPVAPAPAAEPAAAPTISLAPISPPPHAPPPSVSTSPTIASVHHHPPSPPPPPPHVAAHVTPRPSTPASTPAVPVNPVKPAEPPPSTNPWDKDSPLPPPSP